GVGGALAQEGVEPEVIVVDDASTDDSAEVAQRYADADPRVKLIRHTVNTNHVVAFNDGYAEATGEFIVRVDADDMLTPGSLARSVALFDAYPSVGLVYGYPRHFTTQAPPEPVAGPAPSWTVRSGAAWEAGPGPPRARGRGAGGGLPGVRPRPYRHDGRGRLRGVRARHVRGHRAAARVAGAAAPPTGRCTPVAVRADVPRPRGAPPAAARVA